MVLAPNAASIPLHAREQQRSRRTPCVSASSGDPSKGGSAAEVAPCCPGCVSVRPSALSGSGTGRSGRSRTRAGGWPCTPASPCAPPARPSGQSAALRAPALLLRLLPLIARLLVRRGAHLHAVGAAKALDVLAQQSLARRRHATSLQVVVAQKCRDRTRRGAAWTRAGHDFAKEQLQKLGEQSRTRALHDACSRGQDAGLKSSHGRAAGAWRAAPGGAPRPGP